MRMGEVDDGQCVVQWWAYERKEDDEVLRQNDGIS